MKYKYYRIKEKYRDYKGERFFRYHPEDEDVLQVCFHYGKVKRGKAHCIGIYRIARLSFLSNYKGMSYVERIPKSEFMKHFNIIVKSLKP